MENLRTMNNCTVQYHQLFEQIPMMKIHLMYQLTSKEYSFFFLSLGVSWCSERHMKGLAVFYARTKKQCLVSKPAMYFWKRSTFFWFIFSSDLAGCQTVFGLANNSIFDDIRIFYFRGEKSKLSLTFYGVDVFQTKGNSPNNKWKCRRSLFVNLIYSELFSLSQRLQVSYKSSCYYVFISHTSLHLVIW